MGKFTFFKYRQVNGHLLDSLLNGTLFFSLRENLNDPFDCNVDIRKSIQNAIDKSVDGKAENLKEFLRKDEVLDRFQKNVNELGVCAFSLQQESTLMWSHYADNHRGVCIMYEFPMEFLDNGEIIFGVDSAKYEENALTNWLIKNNDLYKESHFEFITSLLKVFLTAKSPDWKYEEEARIIRPEPGLFEIPKEYLKQICFGLHSAPDDVSRIKRIIGDNYEHEVTFCQIKRTDKDFGIIAEEI